MHNYNPLWISCNLDTLMTNGLVTEQGLDVGSLVIDQELKQTGHMHPR